MPLMRCTAQEENARFAIELSQEVANEPIVFPRIAAAGLPVCEVMTLVDDHDVPRSAVEYLFGVCAVYGFVNARDDQLIIQLRSAVRGGPLPKRQVQANEFLEHVSNQARRREVEHPKTWTGREQLLNQQAD